MQQITIPSASCGCGCGVNVNFQGLSQQTQRPPAPPVSFETGCALIQQEIDGNIITGPIVLNTSVQNLEIIAEPEIGEVVFLGPDGNVIDEPTAGEPFYISVPATNTSYLIRLFAAVDNCPMPSDDPGQDPEQETARIRRTQLMAQMAVHAGVRSMYTAAIPENSLLPPCYVVYAQMSFYINPRPVACGRNCGCINVSIRDDAQDDAFTVPCCRCWDWLK